MNAKASDRIRKVTSELSQELLQELYNPYEELTYQPVPHASSDNRPFWRVRFDPSFDTQVRMGLEINDDIVLGRRQYDEADIVTLFSYEAAEQLGISRRHAMLRPTEAKLYIVDLGSTNGTRLNGRVLGPNTPYSISNGSQLTLGRLDFIVTIIQSPATHTAALQYQADLADSLPQIGRVIASQLNVNDVLQQAVALTRLYCKSTDASVWLVDEYSGELYLEAQQGMDDIHIHHLPVADTMAGQVIATGKPVIANRQSSDSQIKVKTGYLVEAVIYVPLTLGGVTIGVLSAAHRGTGELFSNQEEILMTAIADFAAIAVQNARAHQAMQKSLNSYTKIVTAMRYVLSSDVKKLINPTIGYTGILADDAAMDPNTGEIVQYIADSSNQISQIIDRLVEVAMLVDDPSMNFTRCGLVNIVGKVITDLQDMADARSIQVLTDIQGEAYHIKGEKNYLYRSLFNLVANAIKFSPDKARITVTIEFSERGVHIRVSDQGPGIPPDDLPHIFDKYIRAQQINTGATGLGLGLEIVRATADAHSGSVTARNLDEGGAEFTISLPASLRRD